MEPQHYEYFIKTVDSVQDPMNLDTMETTFNGYGANAWELVSVTQVGSKVLAFFKRPTRK
jgi:hypothetical protein